MRGQLQVSEPILIVIMLTLLGIFGLIFFIRASDSDTTVEADRLSALQATEVLQLVSSMPELSCPKSVTVNTYCIDEEKARAFAEVSDRERIYYQPLLGNARLTLRVLSLETGGVEPIVLYDLIVSDHTRSTLTYFTVYDPHTGQRRMATMQLELER